jgi:hypothetical protein
VLLLHRVHLSPPCIRSCTAENPVQRLLRVSLPLLSANGF